MSDDMDALIEKARLFQHGEDWFEENGKVIEAPEFIHRLADALEQLRGERDEALATIEQASNAARWVLTCLDSYSWHRHDESFVRATREHAAVAYDALSNAWTQEYADDIEKEQD